MTDETKLRVIDEAAPDPDKRRRPPGRAWCEEAGQRFETIGPGTIYQEVSANV